LERRVRATTAFNKMLAVPGADVGGVTFTPADIVVVLRRRARRLTCPCGWSTRAVYDRSMRRWRHLDLGTARPFLQAEIRRLDCRTCGRIRTETVPWARPGARFTRDFEDVVAWLAQRTDKTTVTKLLRTSWESVAGIVARVVAEHLDTRRLENIYRIGVDEASHKGHRYLTVVADHDRDGAVMWAGVPRPQDAGTLLRRARRRRLRGAAGGEPGHGRRLPEGHHQPSRAGPPCVDPFHTIKLANQAIDKARRWAWLPTIS